MQLEFAHDVGAVRFGGFYADAKGYSYFLAAFALRKQLHYFALPRREAAAKNGHVVGDCILLAEAIEQHVCSARGKEGTVIAERFDGRDQVAVRVRFHDVRAHAGLNDVADKLIGKVQRQDHYFCFGKAFADASCGLQAVQLGHADVHYDDIGLELFGHGDSFAAGLGFGHDVPAVVRGEQLLEPASDNVMIVSN